MGDYARGRLDLDDDDRLPWLEPAIDETEDDGISPLKLLGLILLGLAIIGVVVAAVWWVQDRYGSGSEGGAQLIEAPAGDYKVAANEADAKKFDGEGDASYAASEGVARDGRIDPSRVPEAPIAKTAPAPVASRPAAPARPSQSVTAKVADETRAPATATAPKPVRSGTIQLGAYGSAALAKDAWEKLSKRFAYLAPLTMTIEPVEIGGSTLYRLRVAAGGQANLICGKLKVAGESCLVVS